MKKVHTGLGSADFNAGSDFVYEPVTYLAGMNELHKEVTCDQKYKSDQYFLKAICQYLSKVLGLFLLQQNYF